MYAYMYACMYVCMYACIVCMYACMHVCIDTRPIAILEAIPLTTLIDPGRGHTGFSRSLHFHDSHGLQIC